MGVIVASDANDDGNAANVGEERLLEVDLKGAIRGVVGSASRAKL